jgi:hypothetical protein
MQMVNVGFPARAGYGFERVDAPGAAAYADGAINRKFTPNQISQLFHKFSAT